MGGILCRLRANQATRCARAHPGGGRKSNAWTPVYARLGWFSGRNRGQFFSDRKVDLARREITVTVRPKLQDQIAIWVVGRRWLPRYLRLRAALILYRAGSRWWEIR